MKLSETTLTASDAMLMEGGSKHPIVLTDANGDAVAAIIPIEDLYLLQKLEDCLSAARPSSRFHAAMKR
jgi:hypothetical protein